MNILNDDNNNELAWLREEDARLKELLQKHGIAFDPEPTRVAPIQKPMPQLSLEEKVALFRSMFRGREDVFARRWYSPKTEKSGYQPVCTREWNPMYCNKNKYKCAECPNREFQSLGYADVYAHLEGKEPNGWNRKPFENCSESHSRYGKITATSESSLLLRSAAKSMSTAPTSTPSSSATTSANNRNTSGF